MVPRSQPWPDDRPGAPLVRADPSCRLEMGRSTVQQECDMPIWTDACASGDIDAEDVIRFDHAVRDRLQLDPARLAGCQQSVPWDQ